MPADRAPGLQGVHPGGPRARPQARGEAEGGASGERPAHRPHTGHGAVRAVLRVHGARAAVVPHRAGAHAGGSAAGAGGGAGGGGWAGTTRVSGALRGHTQRSPRRIQGGSGGGSRWRARKFRKRRECGKCRWCGRRWRATGVRRGIARGGRRRGNGVSVYTNIAAGRRIRRGRSSIVKPPCVHPGSASCSTASSSITAAWTVVRIECK
mmetsp:Transcript_22526/g.55759  ORF Transcript_22526/g.55759 Transcript_22526/m.55759 type:complete len:209 (+) Transcript_22526:201-827(+)